jgi:transcriptional regulator with GAF, ATPase, and Fis domain
MNSVESRSGDSRESVTSSVGDLISEGSPATGQEGRASSLAEIEREHIVRILERTQWRIEGLKGAAVLLGINPATLRSRMKRLGIHRPPKKAS